MASMGLVLGATAGFSTDITLPETRGDSDTITELEFSIGPSVIGRKFWIRAKDFLEKYFNIVLSALLAAVFFNKAILQFHHTIQCTSDIVATLGHYFLATISDWPLYTTWKKKHFVPGKVATISEWLLESLNVATISRVHCTKEHRGGCTRGLLRPGHLIT